MIVTSFLDTNILLYLASREQANATKKAIAAKIIRDQNIGVSVQVLQEFYTVAIRKAEFGLTPADGLEWLERLEKFPCAPITQSLVKTAALLSIRYDISFWDGAIIAAAASLGAPILYTEDLNNGQVYGSVTAINPFIESAGSFHEEQGEPFKGTG